MRIQISRCFTLIELMIVVAIIAIIAALAIPNLVSSRKAANETAALGALKSIQSAQVLFFETDADKDNTRDYAVDLAELDTFDMVDDAIGSGSRSGYNLRTAAGTNAPNAQWWADAIPIVVGGSGDKHYAVNHGSIIFFSPTPITIDAATAALTGGTPIQ